MIRFRFGVLVTLCLAVLVVMAGCSKDKKESTTPDPNPPDTSDYEAAGSVTTTQESTVSTESGASIDIPMYAVPPTDGGDPGTMTFSIERDTETTATPPSGHLLGSDVYRFGPDGFTFAEMVELTIPVTGDTTGKEITINRIDPNTGATEIVGGAYDPATNTISTQRYHLSPYFASMFTPSETAWGAFHVTNNSSSHWLHLCVEVYNLKYPQADPNYDGNSWSTWAPFGHIGWANEGDWFLPQGDYTICVQVSRSGTISTPPGDPERWEIQKSLNNPWSRYAPSTTEISIVGPPFGDAEDGACPCTPTPSTSVGTGELQVTLTWHNSLPIDLDLWVTEPDGTQCYYGNATTTNGGTLDRDNLCSNYVNGRPENMFWASAPAGQYKIQVKLYSTCGSDISSQSFDVRAVIKGVAKTYTGSVSTGSTTVDVATITVSAGKQGTPHQFGPYDGTPSTTEMPPKE